MKEINKIRSQTQKTLRLLSRIVPTALILSCCHSAAADFQFEPTDRDSGTGRLAEGERLHLAQASPAKPIKTYTEEDAETAMLRAIKERTVAGVFTFHDPRLGKDLKLKFEKVKIVRGMSGFGWFPNAVFQDSKHPGKRYAIDFWFKADGERLRLMDIRVQKGPKRDGDDYIMVTRYPVAWWWLPVSEHPGDTEVTRAWQVMSAIHKHIADRRKDGAYHLTDDKTGETIPLEFVEIHQPVRRLKEDGRYFACTDFRKAGSANQFYDIDFWLDEKNGAISVGDVRIHKVPVQDPENGNWYQEKRYNFKGLDFETVR